MSADWHLSPAAVEHLSRGMAVYREKVGRPDFPYCPFVGWSLGGELILASGERQATPAGYVVGIAAIANIAPNGYVRIDDPTLGIVAFQPHEPDVASERRLIDHDGERFVLR